MSISEGITFEAYQRDFLTLKALEQDLKSALYAVHPFPNSSDPEFYVILYPNLEIGEVEYSVIDKNHMELRLLAQLPKTLTIFIGQLYQKVLDWADGNGPYPHSFFQLSYAEEVASDIGNEYLDELSSRKENAEEVIKNAMLLNT